MTKYRGVLTLVENTRSTNVAENTPFRQMAKGEMFSAKARQLDGVALGAALNARAVVQVGRTVLFDGQINSNLTDAASATGSTNVASLLQEDILFMGPLPKGGTLNVQFVGAEAAEVLWELGGEVYD